MSRVFAEDHATEAYRRLFAYVVRVQDEACLLDALIEGMVILKDHEKGGNAFNVLLSIVQEKAFAIYSALDSVHLPKLEPVPA